MSDDGHCDTEGCTRPARFHMEGSLRTERPDVHIPVEVTVCKKCRDSVYAPERWDLDGDALRIDDLDGREPREEDRGMCDFCNEGIDGDRWCSECEGTTVVAT